MKLFKNFQTKRQLREENKRLKFMLNRPEPIHFVEREVEKVSFCTEIEENIPTEVIKRQIARGLIDYLEPFIEWDFEDVSDKNIFRKQVRGNIYLAKRRGGNRE